MASSGTVPLKEIWRALDECLPGYRRVEKLHNWWVYPPKGSMFVLPLGSHGARNNVDIQRGHVKSMGRQFAVLDCLKGKLPGL